jgi:hypothetical protein
MTGLASLMKTLAELPTKISNKLVKPAMQEAGNLLAGQARANAWRQLQGALARGYKDRDAVSLYATAGTRVKTYKKGETTFVAVGFDYSKGGSHAHLVELGHNIVTGGTAQRTWIKRVGLTAAGRRLAISRIVYSRAGGEIPSARYVQKVLSAIPSFIGTTRVRGGGKLTGNRTRKFPMLRPAFDTMQRPMLIAIENELRKIEPVANELARTYGLKK